MAVFQYKGLDGGGAGVGGIIDADNAKVARTKLRKQGLFPTEIWEQKGGRAKGLSMEVNLGKMFERISQKTRAIPPDQDPEQLKIDEGVPDMSLLRKLTPETPEPQEAPGI